MSLEQTGIVVALITGIIGSLTGIVSLMWQIKGQKPKLKVHMIDGYFQPALMQGHHSDDQQIYLIFFMMAKISNISNNPTTLVHVSFSPEVRALNGVTAPTFGMRPYHQDDEFADLYPHLSQYTDPRKIEPGETEIIAITRCSKEPFVESPPESMMISLTFKDNYDREETAKMKIFDLRAV